MTTEAVVGVETKLALTVITANPNNPRIMLDKSELTSLTASLAAVGLIQPIVVRRKESGFEIVAGHRRCAAAKALGWTEIPVIVRDVKDADLMTVATTENVQRADMHPLDEALACRKLTLEEGRTQGEVAALLAKSQAWVAQRLSLLGLSPKCRTAFKTGKFSMAVALVLARIPNAKLQDEVFEEAQDGEGFITQSAPSLAEEVLRSTSQVLAEAPFDSKDAALVPKAGACLTCIKRTSACVSLFEDLGKKSDRCLDSQCWESKSTSHREAILKDARAKGTKIIEGEAAQHARYSGAYMKLDETCYEHPKRWNWRRVMAERPFETVLIVDRGAVVECVTKETAQAALLALLPPAAKKKEEKKQKDEKERKVTESQQRKVSIENNLLDREYTFEAARQAAATADRAGLTPAIRGLMLDHLLESLNHDGRKIACNLYGIEPVQKDGFKEWAEPLLKWRKDLKPDKELGCILAFIFMREASFTTKPLKKLLPLLGLDPTAVHRKAVATRANQKALKDQAKKKGKSK